MTAANTANFKFRYGDGGSPEAFTAIDEAFSISGVGQTNDQEQVTNFDSPAGQHEYIAARAEGDEITVEANYVAASTSQEAVVALVAAQTNVNFQIAYTGVSPEITMTFVGTPIGWRLVPNVTGRNTIQFVIKISSITTNNFAT